MRLTHHQEPSVKRGIGDAGKPQKPETGNRSLNPILVMDVLLFVVSAALLLAGQLSQDQRKQLTAGSIGGAVGLLTGYGIGRYRR